ncbi:MAG: hypothetical protein MUF81_18115, partial [Verrucomicrobia bacterium]|nr:hypothetical protein [Verrucomicrobiota bacterium]
MAERGAHHRTWNKVVTRQDDQGRTVMQTNTAYMELTTGLHYLDPKTGQWNETQELIESYPGGAIARHGAHKVIFANNLNAAGAIDLEMPDGRRMQSHVLGLGYFDSASGQSVLFAEVKDCQGQLVSRNQIIYPDAFTDFRASVRLTYSKAGLEQDVILEERPPRPEEYGLSSATTRLMVLTEFVSPVQPAIQAVTATARAGVIPDQLLDFGGMAMGPGMAFAIGQSPTAPGRIPVSKEWAIIEGRNILLEQVAVSKVAVELNRLPPPAQPSVTEAGSNSVRHLVSTQRRLPGAKAARADLREMQLAKLERPATGLVLDYALLNSTQT